MIHVANITQTDECRKTATGEHLFDYEYNGIPHFWCRQCGKVYSVVRNDYGDMSLINEHPDNL